MAAIIGRISSNTGTTTYYLSDFVQNLYLYLFKIIDLRILGIIENIHNVLSILKIHISFSYCTRIIATLESG